MAANRLLFFYAVKHKNNCLNVCTYGKKVVSLYSDKKRYNAMKWNEMTAQQVQEWANKTSYKLLTRALMRYEDKAVDLRAEASNYERAKMREEYAGIDSEASAQACAEIYAQIDKAEMFVEILKQEARIRRTPLFCNLAQGFGSTEDWKQIANW